MKGPRREAIDYNECLALNVLGHPWQAVAAETLGKVKVGKKGDLNCLLALRGVNPWKPRSSNLADLKTWLKLES